VIVPKDPHLGRMLKYIGTPLLLLVAWDVAVVVAYNVFGQEWVGFSQIPLALYGSVIGIIVGFRNNSAYSRWWEARILWGSIVNNSRSLGRQVVAMVDPSRSSTASEPEAVEDLKRRLVYHQIAYVHALRQHLRGLDPLAELPPLLSETEIDPLRGAPNAPLAIQHRMAAMLRDARDRNWINALEWQAMDGNLDDLADAQGGSERIKNTPLPKQYDYFPMLFVRVYCILLPCGMVAQLGWFTPLGSTLVGFMFLALEKIGRDIENPFDNTVFDIPMTSICRTIEINLRHLLGESNLPAPLQPERGVLW
jgi:putative membrane protein